MGSPFYFLPQESVWVPGLVVPSDPGYSSLPAGPDSRTEGEQVRIKLTQRQMSDPSFPRPMSLCWILGGHCRNLHCGLRAGRESSGGHGHPTPRGHPASCEHPCPPRASLPSSSIPARTSERSQLSPNTPKLGPGCLLSFVVAGLSPFIPRFYFLFPAKSAQDSYPSLFPDENSFRYSFPIALWMAKKEKVRKKNKVIVLEKAKLGIPGFYLVLETR